MAYGSADASGDGCKAYRTSVLAGTTPRAISLSIETTDERFSHAPIEPAKAPPVRRARSCPSSRPAMRPGPRSLLLHGFPGSADYFREVMPELSQVAYVIAPDLPGFGQSDVLPALSFRAFGEAIAELLDRLAVGPRYHLPARFRRAGGVSHRHAGAGKGPKGLIVQNAQRTSHRARAAMGPGDRTTGRIQTRRTKAACDRASDVRGARATAISGDAAGGGGADPGRKSGKRTARDAVARPDGNPARALVTDYGNYVARFDDIADISRAGSRLP